MHSNSSQKLSPLTCDLLIVAVAAVILLTPCVSPPGLMDDVDAVQAQIARAMLETGDWVTPRLNGVAYMEKPPLKYWMIAASFGVFGIHDWSARLPLILAHIALCVVTGRMTRWAFGSPRAGLYAGVALASSVGLFLFTRILIVDATLTLAVAVAMWSFLRVIDDDEPHPQRWAATLAVSIGCGLLLKGLIAAVFPCGAIFAYMTLTKRLFDREAWRRIRPLRSLALLCAVAAPWHIAATLRNPPYFDFSFVSEPGQYRGFFWFYFFNEHILRFLGRRHPRDYNTVPRLWFWLSHLVWFFPWSAFLPGVFKLGFTRSPQERAGRAKLLALCWIGFVMTFFTFSTTQEYYSLPMYPGLAMLLGGAMARGEGAVRNGGRIASAIAGVAAVAVMAILYLVKDLPAPGDIAEALKKSADVYSTYTLSLGHMGDLTLASFAYLRVPLCVAGVAFLIGAVGPYWKLGASLRGIQPFAALTVMMMTLLVAARIAMVAFDPYLGSRPLAEALRRSSPGVVIVDNQYYAFSSVFFYADLKNAFLLNGRITNLEYGSYAPNAPNVFINDADFQTMWGASSRAYLLVEDVQLARIERLVGKERLHAVVSSGGKFLFCNQP